MILAEAKQPPQLARTIAMRPALTAWGKSGQWSMIVCKFWGSRGGSHSERSRCGPVTRRKRVQIKKATPRNPQKTAVFRNTSQTEWAIQGLNL